MISDNKLNEVNILLCEDDESLGMLLREYLEAKGYNTTLCQDGEEGLATFEMYEFNLCILDVMMPRMDGFTLARRIRELNQETPFMFLTAKNLKEDVREGFELGADDYITKPFSMEEVVYRIEAILRYNGVESKLTTKEAELLTLLSNRPNELLQRDYALKTIWIDDNYFNARSMDVYITKLRKHLRADKKVEIINVHGKGYKLVVSDSSIQPKK